MKVYKFKCDSCGSKNCVKIENGYKCEYCGSVQDVIVSSAEISENVYNQNSVNQDNYRQENKILSEKKSILIRLLICIFAGYFGIHKFMEKRIVAGVIYIFTYGLLGIGLLIDIIKYIIELAHVDGHGGETW